MNTSYPNTSSSSSTSVAFGVPVTQPEMDRIISRLQTLYSTLSSEVITNSNLINKLKVIHEVSKSPEGRKEVEPQDLIGKLDSLVSSLEGYTARLSVNNQHLSSIV